MNDWQQAQAFFRTDPLKYLVHLKYMHLYGDSMTCRVLERDRQRAVLLRYPTGRVVWDTTAYPMAELVLLPAAETPAMAEVLLHEMRQNGLLERCQVIKFCEADTEALMVDRLKLEFARALRSYTSGDDVHYEPHPDVRIESQPSEAHIAAFVANGYSASEIDGYFKNGTTLFSIYDGRELLSSCMTYQNFDEVWEVAGVHTHASARRKGYARQVVQTALWHLLKVGRIPRYHVEMLNTASIQLAEGLGLRPCLQFTHYVYQPTAER
jgi:predicted GNAT family acetyltransferase